MFASNTTCCCLFEYSDRLLVMTMCSGNALVMSDGAGRTVWRKTGHHYESVDVGEIREDVPGLESVVGVLSATVQNLRDPSEDGWPAPGRTRPAGQVRLRAGRQARRLLSRRRRPWIRLTDRRAARAGHGDSGRPAVAHGPPRVPTWGHRQEITVRGGDRPTSAVEPRADPQRGKPLDTSAGARPACCFGLHRGFARSAAEGYRTTATSTGLRSPLATAAGQWQ